MVLASLGLSGDEEGLYRALVEFPSATPAALSSTTGMPSTDVETLLKSLTAQGLVARTGSTTDGRYVAASPAIALGPLVRQRREDLRRAELELAALTERYFVSAADRTAGDLVEVVTGVELIAKRFQQLQAGAREEVRALVTMRTMAVPRAENPAEDEGVRRGVKYRVVMERGILDQAGAEADTIGALRSGEEVRVLERVPIKLLIADKTHAMVPMDRDGSTAAALLVHRSGLLDALLALFDAAWERGRPLRIDAETLAETEPPDGIDDDDRRILVLLLAGLTDASVASQLNLSMRTVQRRVRELMDLAGVHTRLQLGWHAARHGWVNP
jgi:sugar-specific transcriptional regulator TrmB/DNA-binding CsgD family transcriptional regulator